MEMEENDTITTLEYKLRVLQQEFSAVAKISYEYTVKGEQLEQKIDEIQKQITRLKDGN